MNQILYRFWNSADELLYVGITMNLPDRWKKHNREKSWSDEVAKITMERFRTRAEVEQAEIDAIQSERPRYNVTYNRRGGVGSGTHPDDCVILEESQWWTDDCAPHLMHVFWEFAALLRESPIQVSNHTWRTFMDHLAHIDLFLDYCRECQTTIHSPDYDAHVFWTRNVYGPLAILPSGVCEYECRRGHEWRTYYAQAEGLRIPRYLA